MWSRLTDQRSSDRRAGALRARAVFHAGAFAAVLLAAACGGRDAWLHDPLPERGPAVDTAPLPARAPRVRLTTTVGDIVVGLYEDRAPISSANFLRYVDEGFYDGTIFHRVEPPTALAVVQGGGYDQDLSARPTHDPIVSEADNGLANRRGTVALARRGNDTGSATSQFFINYLDNPSLDHAGPDHPGYTVFGIVVEGIEIVDRITLVPTAPEPGTTLGYVPMVPLVIERAQRDP